jgi:predicted nucleic acid-binding protein
MSGIDFLADTNFLIAVHEGDPSTKSFLDQTVAVSIISEIELLGGNESQKPKKRNYVRC